MPQTAADRFDLCSNPFDLFFSSRACGLVLLDLVNKRRGQEALQLELVLLSITLSPGELLQQYFHAQAFFRAGAFELM